MCHAGIPLEHAGADDESPNVSESSPSIAVRDLLWAINSPSLIEGESAVGRLEVEKIDLGLLQVFLGAHRSFKVGHYFESLVHFWLEKVRRVEMVAHRRQIKNSDRTLGELDFVFRDEQERLNHWETAVKFYLFDPDNEVNGSRFIGPNTADTLERKLDRLLQHQLPLSACEFPEVEIRRAFVKGWLYRNPFHTVDGDLPNGVSPDHLAGVWIRHAQADWLDRFDNGTEFQILEKPHWLAASPAPVMDVNNLLGRLDAHFESQKQSIHVGISVDGVELERLFVVPDRWPDL